MKFMAMPYHVPSGAPDMTKMGTQVIGRFSSGLAAKGILALPFKPFTSQAEGLGQASISIDMRQLTSVRIMPCSTGLTTRGLENVNREPFRTNRSSFE